MIIGFRAQANWLATKDDDYILAENLEAKKKIPAGVRHCGGAGVCTEQALLAAP